MRDIQAEPLTAEAFRPFGDVLSTEGARPFAINEGTTERYHDLARIQLLGEGARPQVSIFRGRAFQMPVRLRVLERHPLGSQAFMPLGAEPYLVVVAPPGERVRAEDIQAFLARPGQGVNYHAGVWHHPVLALSRTSDFLVVDRGGPGTNCEERGLPDSMRVTAPAAGGL